MLDRMASSQPKNQSEGLNPGDVSNVVTVGTGLKDGASKGSNLMRTIRPAVKGVDAVGTTIANYTNPKNAGQGKPGSGPPGKKKTPHQRKKAQKKAANRQKNAPKKPANHNAMKHMDKKVVKPAQAGGRSTLRMGGHGLNGAAALYSGYQRYHNSVGKGTTAKTSEGLAQGGIGLGLSNTPMGLITAGEQLLTSKKEDQNVSGIYNSAGSVVGATGHAIANQNVDGFRTLQGAPTTSSRSGVPLTGPR
jgi:hypothetical protein